MYNDVIKTMSTAQINILTQRPLLRHLKHLTLKYFEIFCADTIPLLMLDEDHAELVYGPAGRELTLPGRAAEKILDALRIPTGTDRLSRMFVAISSRTTPTISGSRSWLRRSGVENA